MPTLAHLSDLHLGQSQSRGEHVSRLFHELLVAGVDHVVVTGDITHSGQRREYQRFLEVTSPFERSGRLTVVPGNHDRCGDDIGELVSGGRRVWVESREDLYLVCVDSTAPHNRASFRAHGEICARTLELIDVALSRAPARCLTAVLLHHHPLPLPVETIGEWFAERFGWPHAAELPLGRDLLKSVLGRCDLLLHGHRHLPREFLIEVPGRPLRIYNAGSSSELRACRLFDITGRRSAAPVWLEAAPPSRRSRRQGRASLETIVVA